MGQSGIASFPLFEHRWYKLSYVRTVQSYTLAPAGLGIPGHCPCYFESCVLILRGLDAKTHHQCIAYACTDVRIAYSVVTKYAFHNWASNAAYPSLAWVPTQLSRYLCMYTLKY